MQDTGIDSLDLTFWELIGVLQPDSKGGNPEVSRAIRQLEHKRTNELWITNKGLYLLILDKIKFLETRLYSTNNKKQRSQDKTKLRSNWVNTVNIAKATAEREARLAKRLQPAG